MFLQMREIAALPPIIFMFIFGLVLRVVIHMVFTVYSIKKGFRGIMKQKLIN